MEISCEKGIFRKSAIEARNTLTEHDVIYKSSKIVEKLFQLLDFKNSEIIMCYLDFKNEVMTKDFIKGCFDSGKKVAVPLITSSKKENREMVAAEVLNLDEDLEEGNYGILEPKKDRIKVIDPKEIDLCIVPGVAFDLKKNRMGYGAGYYDRFLKNMKKECLKIGVAFEIQIFENIPIDKNDIALDLLITEKRYIV